MLLTLFVSLLASTLVLGQSSTLTLSASPSPTPVPGITSRISSGTTTTSSSSGIPPIVGNTSTTTTSSFTTSFQSSSIITSSSVTLNASISSTASNATATSNSTTNSTANGTIVEGMVEHDVWFGAGEDEVEPPLEFRADEQVLTLAYTANYDQARCRQLAQGYAQGSTAMMRRHWAGVEFKRKRELRGKTCFPAVYTIPTYIHWVPPRNAPAGWVNSAALDSTLGLARKQLRGMNIALDVKRRVVWKVTDDTEYFTILTMGDLKFASSFTAHAKTVIKSTDYASLNIFIVENPSSASDSIAGFANYPGVAGGKNSADSVVIGSNTLLGNSAIKDKTRNWVGYSTQGTTFAHEVGHWLGLKHLHVGGCNAKNDGIDTTLSYPGEDYTYSCPLTAGGAAPFRGKNAVYEANLMSYSTGRNVTHGYFNREQAVRAVVGYMIRRQGVKKGSLMDQDSNAVYLKQCGTTSRVKRDEHIIVPRNLVPLTKRQTAATLSTFCDSTDLGVVNYGFSPLAETGLYSADSPSIPNQPATPPSVNVNTGQPDDTPGQTGSNFQAVKQQVEQDIQNGRNAWQAATTMANVPAPTTTKAAAAGKAAGSGWGLVMAVIGVGLGGLGLMG